MFSLVKYVRSLPIFLTRMFSTQAPPGVLLRLLHNELKSLESRFGPMKNPKAIFKARGFDLHESPYESDILLTQKVKDTHVTVKYKAKTIKPKKSEEWQTSDEEKVIKSASWDKKRDLRNYFNTHSVEEIAFDDAIMEAIEHPMKLEITITQKDGGGLIIDAKIKGSVLQINHLTHCKDVGKLADKSIIDRIKLHYPGPDMRLLGFNAQNSMYAYLNSLGIGDGLVKIIEKAAFDKAMRLRIGQLRAIIKFLTN